MGGEIIEGQTDVLLSTSIQATEKAILCCDPVLTKIGISLDSNSEIFFTI